MEAREVGKENEGFDPHVDHGSYEETRAFQPPALVKAMSPEQRRHAERALVRKIDIRLLPMVILMYIMNYLDRNNIAAAKLAGLQSDLNLSSVQYSVGSLVLLEQAFC